MTTNPKGYITSYYHKRRNETIQLLGNHCSSLGCNATKLEFAHIKSTNVKGTGLSGWARIYDALMNPECYTLFCKYHHERYDHEVKQ